LGNGVRFERLVTGMGVNETGMEVERRREERKG
jgi:hypothetical protein